MKIRENAEKEIIVNSITRGEHVRHLAQRDIAEEAGNVTLDIQMASVTSGKTQEDVPEATDASSVIQ